jgi:hypothetical protein
MVSLVANLIDKSSRSEGRTRLTKFSDPNGRLGETRCIAKKLPQHLRGNAASAKARN